MPLVRIDWFEGRTVEQKREVAEVLTRELARVGRCAPEDVEIIFNDVRRSDWAMAGRLFSDGAS